MALDGKSVRRWVSRFDAVERAELDAFFAAGPQPQWSMSVALAIISAASKQGKTSWMTDGRQEEEEDARAVWLRLKART